MKKRYKNQQLDLILNSLFPEINDLCIFTTFIQSPIKDLGTLPWVSQSVCLSFQDGDIFGQVKA